MDEDLRLLEQNKKTFKRIILLNKTDLPTKIDMDKVKGIRDRQRDCHNVNAQEKGASTNWKKRLPITSSKDQMNERDATYLSNTRHIALLENREQALQEVANGVDMGMPVDLIQIDFTRAWDLLGEIWGDHCSRRAVNTIVQPVLFREPWD